MESPRSYMQNTTILTTHHHQTQRPMMRKPTNRHIASGFEHMTHPKDDLNFVGPLVIIIIHFVALRCRGATQSSDTTDDSVFTIRLGQAEPVMNHNDQSWL